jgi:hypothetical protein
MHSTIWHSCIAPVTRACGYRLTRRRCGTCVVARASYLLMGCMITQKRRALCAGTT